MKKSILIIILLFFIIAACNTQSESNNQEVNIASIQDTEWILIELNGRAIPAANSNKKPHFKLQSDSVIIGNGGCNNFRGKYSIASQNNINISTLVSTRMACMDVDYETEFLTALEQSEKFEKQGDTLALLNSGAVTTAKFVNEL